MAPAGLGQHGGHRICAKYQGIGVAGLQAGQAGAGAAAQVENLLGFEADVIQPLRHAPAHFLGDEGGGVVAGRRASEGTPHLAAVHQGSRRLRHGVIRRA